MLKPCQVSCVLIVLLCCLSQRNVAAQNKIVGGTVTTIKKVPYIAYLLKNDNFHCAGSLVRTNFVVTAGHCGYGLAASELKAVGGATYLTDTGVRRSVTQIIFHPNYNYSTRDNDLAVLKLNSPMTGTNIGTIALCSSNWKAGDMITVSGWGDTTENGSVSNRLRTVQLPLISKATCQKRYGRSERITNTMFCTHKTGKDACQGDSGSGAIFNGQLCGVVSWGYGCARAQYPGVYASLRNNLAFINNAIAGQRSSNSKFSSHKQTKFIKKK